jgi:hypothetical protein
MTVSSSNSNRKPSCTKKGASSKLKHVPYEEMERLMNVYGSIKALRNRGVKSGKTNGDLKKDSIKRKFYRWFPDLEERFCLDKDGRFQPIHGHEHEVKYRKEMRSKSSDLVAKKRAKTNKKNNTSVNGKLILERDDDMSLPPADRPLPDICTSSSRRPLPSPPTRKVTFNDQDIITSLVSEDEDEASVIDESFHASGAIFDEVNEEFYGDELEVCSSNSNDSVIDESLDAISSNVSMEDDLELWGNGLIGNLIA